MARLTLPVKCSPRGTAPLTLRETRKPQAGPEDRSGTSGAFPGTKTPALLILWVSRVIQQAFVLCTPEIYARNHSSDNTFSLTLKPEVKEETGLSVRPNPLTLPNHPTGWEAESGISVFCFFPHSQTYIYNTGAGSFLVVSTS